MTTEIQDKRCPFYFDSPCRKEKCAIYFKKTFADEVIREMCGLMALTISIFNIQQEGVTTYDGGKQVEVE